MISFNDTAHLVSTIFKVGMVILLISVVSITNSLSNLPTNKNERTENVIINEKIY